jgi:hypothetical protein
MILLAGSWVTSGRQCGARPRGVVTRYHRFPHQSFRSDVATRSKVIIRDGMHRLVVERAMLGQFVATTPGEVTVWRKS